MAWRKLPPKRGGLGIHIPVALLARVLWNIHTQGRYVVGEKVSFEALQGDWQPKKGDSPLLRRLADIRGLIVGFLHIRGSRSVHNRLIQH
ncbi:UNVERIFIED_CONTAM: hypothetical protein Sradi_2364200 [Sesamum radiatum]|uniref:Uncharacterized protein n=1 Tax=Sesamum radiatum TaxID=300843 RepID=A0AAW2T644_SESRA